MLKYPFLWQAFIISKTGSIEKYSKHYEEGHLSLWIFQTFGVHAGTIAAAVMALVLFLTLLFGPTSVPLSCAESSASRILIP